MGQDASCIMSNEPPLPDETPVYNSPMMMKYSSERLMLRFPDMPDVGTIEDLFTRTKSIAPDNDFYGYRPYENGIWQNRFDYISRATFSNFRDAIGSYLVSQNIQSGGHIGILSNSRIEWVLAQFACYGYGFIPVPIYDTFGWPNINYIIKHSELEYVFCISTKVVDLITNLDSDSCLKQIIVIDSEENPLDYQLIPQCNIHLISFKEVQAFPQRYPIRPPQPQTPAFIMYTSGTTGHPKGCIMTHANFISTAASIYMYAYPFDSNDSMLSYLPLSHVYESVQHIVAMKVIGARVAFYSGSIARLVEEIQLLRPTIICGVARVFERIKDGICDKIAKQSLPIRMIFNAAYKTKSFLSSNFRIRHVPIIDSIFNAVCNGLGGRVKLFVSGGSALDPRIQDFLRIACRASFLQGYGLTESCSSCCVQTSTDVKNGNCGAFLPWAEGKLRSVPELGYFARNNQGEMLLRGPSIFQGYYKDQESTEKAFDPNGWFITGDIFEITPTRQLKVIARCKEVVKLAQGEYISLQKLYPIYESAGHVKQIYIHAGMTARFLTAIVIPDVENITEREMLNSLNSKADEHNLLGFERIGAVYLSNVEFTTDNGLMTPSLKLCTYKIQEYFKKQLAQME